MLDEAISAYSKGLELDPGNEGLKSGIVDAKSGLVWRRCRRLRSRVEKKLSLYLKDQRMHVFGVLLNINLRNTNASGGTKMKREWRAAVYLEMEKYEECIVDCDSAVERGRELRSDFKMIARALTIKGTALVKMAKCSKDFEPAIETFQKALTEHRNPDTLKRLNDAEKSKKELKQQEYFEPNIADQECEKGLSRVWRVGYNSLKIQFIPKPTPEPDPDAGHEIQTEVFTSSITEEIIAGKRLSRPLSVVQWVMPNQALAGAMVAIENPICGFAGSTIGRETATERVLIRDKGGTITLFGTQGTPPIEALVAIPSGLINPVIAVASLELMKKIERGGEAKFISIDWSPLNGVLAGNMVEINTKISRVKVICCERERHRSLERRRESM
ncbi:hypothetical protein GIB67_008746 [Kingdonia uniflora]|uniref:Uncharacterized protein n=1 Tax=Kingdonia uniflora TaxID=39325 RepID=A0A7J7P5J0_9MAGN|nr:hypothetical protein GIB67_008746 [Kingdonia uniflora]